MIEKGELGARIIPLPLQKPEELAELEMESRLTRAARFCGKAALRLGAIGALSAASALAGSMLTPAHTTLGPHEAEIKLTVDGTLTIDGGAIDSFKKSIRGYGGMGANIEIKGIPLDEEDAPASQEFTSDDVEAYVRFFTDPENDIAGARKDVAEHALSWGIAGDLAGLGLYIFLGSRARRELMTGHRARVLATTGLLGMSWLASSMMASEVKAPIEGDPIFAGTPAEGMHAYGKITNGITNDLLPRILGEVSKNKQLYDALLVNFKKEALYGNLLTDEKDVTTLAYVSERHCNMNMNKVIGEVVRMSHSEQVVDTGDSVLGGTILDEKCTEAFNYRLRNTKRIVVEGNHRSPETAAQERKNGATVLEGKTVSVGGLRYLGAPNQNISLFGSDLQPATSITNAQLGKKLAATACNDPEGIDVIIGATPDAVVPTLQKGCAKLGFSGGRGEKILWITTQAGDQVPFYRVGNTGGVEDNQLSIGPLQQPATMALIQIDRSTHQPLRQQTITFNPDGNVVIGEIDDWTTSRTTIAK